MSVDDEYRIAGGLALGVVFTAYVTLFGLAITKDQSQKQVTKTEQCRKIDVNLAP